MALGGALKSVFTRFTFGIDGGKLSAINRTTGQAVSNLSMAAKQSQALKNQVGGFLGNIKGFIALAAGSALIRGVTTGFAQAADQVAKFSKATGVATDTYQGLIHGAALSGVTQEEVNKGLLQLSKRARDASRGMKATKDAFDEVGISVTDSGGKLKNGDTILMELADRFKKMPDGSRKTALAMELMGRTGARMNVLLNEGSGGIKNYIADAKKLGIVLSGKALADAEKFNDEWLRAKSVFIGLRNQIALRLIPAITKGIKSFVEWTREGNNATNMLRALAAVAGIAAVIIANMVRAFIIAQWESFVLAIKSAVAWFKLLNLQMVLAGIKVAAIGAGIILLAAIIEDLVYFAQGERSLIGRVFGQPKDILWAIGVLKDAWNILNGILSSSFTALWEAIVDLGAAFNIELTTAGDALKWIGKILFKTVLFAILAVAFALAGLVTIVSAIIWAVTKLIHAIVYGLTGAVSGLADFFGNFGEAVEDIFENIEMAGLVVANALKDAFEASARFAQKAWGKFKTFLGTIKDVAVSLGGRAKNFVLRRTEGVTGGLPSTAPAQPAPSGGRAPVVTSNVTVNANGLDEPAATRVAKAAAEAAVQASVNGVARDLIPSVTGLPVGVL